MKKYLVLFLFLFGAGTGFGQSPWQATTPFPKQDPIATTSLATSPTSNYFFVSVEEEGLYRSTDAGGTWSKVITSPVYTVEVRRDGTVFAGGIGVMHVSSDQGQTWVQYAIASDSPVSKIVFNSQGHVFAGTSDFAENSNSDFFGDGVFISRNNGQTWQQLNDGLTGSLAIEALAIDSEDRLYLGISDDVTEAGGGIYTLAPGATAWTYIPISFRSIVNFKVRYVHCIAVDKNNHLYITIEGSHNRVGVLRTLKSENGGATWDIFALGESPYGDYFDDFAFYNLFQSKSGTLWGCMQIRTGIAYTTNNGQSWNSHTTGIGPTTNIFVFAETADNQMLTMHKYDGNIVYKSSNPLQVQKPNKAAALSLTAYPNPFQSELNITYSLEKPAETTVTVSDALGNQKFVQRVSAGAASKIITWHPENLPAGIYFVRLQAGRQSVVQKVVLVK